MRPPETVQIKENSSFSLIRCVGLLLIRCVGVLLRLPAWCLALWLLFLVVHGYILLFGFIINLVTKHL